MVNQQQARPSDFKRKMVSTTAKTINNSDKTLINSVIGNDYKVNLDLFI